MTLPVAVALGAGDVKTVEDLAGLVPDDLRGWFESKDGERVREAGHPGDLRLLDAADAEALIMRARVAMGWVEAPPEPEPEEEIYEEELEGELGPKARRLKVNWPRVKTPPPSRPSTWPKLKAKRARPEA